MGAGGTEKMLWGGIVSDWIGVYPLLGGMHDPLEAKSQAKVLQGSFDHSHKLLPSYDLRVEHGHLPNLYDR
jgi:hypothetical protein